MVVIIAIASVSSKRLTTALPSHIDCVLRLRWAGGRSGCAELVAGDVFLPLATNHCGLTLVPQTSGEDSRTEVASSSYAI
jgi:hypothetical protein